MTEDAAQSPAVSHIPANPAAIQQQEDFTHLRYARGYICHSPELTPDVPDFWQHREFAGRTFRWDPRVSVAVVSSQDHEVLICGHALDPHLGTTDLQRIAQKLHTALTRSRRRYLNVLEEMFGQYVVLDRSAGTVRVQSDAIASRAVFHDGDAGLIASHVGLVGRTLGRKHSRFTQWVGNTTNNDFPGRTTLYDDVWLLTPNTELSLGTGTIRRIGPRPFTPMTVGEAAAEMQTLIEKQVRVLLGSGRQLVVSASAGVDSRTSLAAFAQAEGKENVQVFTYTKALGSGRQSRELHQDKLAATMSEDLGLRHKMFDLNTAERAPEKFIKVLKGLSPRRSNTVISWVYHQELPHDALHIRGQINGVGKWHFAKMLHFSESMDISARRMASLTKRGKDVPRPLDDPWWKLGEEGFQEYIDTTKLRSVPTGYRMTDMFLWEHRVANWNHSHIVESDVTFDTYQLFGSRKMIRLMLSVPELDRVQLTLFRELIERLEPSLVEYPLNGKAWPESRYDLPLSHYQRGTTATEERLEKKTREAESFRKRLRSSRKKVRTLEQENQRLREQLERQTHKAEELDAALRQKPLERVARQAKRLATRSR